jgi:glycosyltransferase involved in cell wall biosynthesis
MITILTTVYNGYEFLDECAQSVISQQCSDDTVSFTWEWWIGINGHGPDGGPALKAALDVAKDPRIHVVNLSVKGRVASLNELRRVAVNSQTEWVAILDCDDIWEREKLITQLYAVKLSKKPIDIVGTFCLYFGEHGGSPNIPSGWIALEDIMRSNPLINSSVLMKVNMEEELCRWEDRFGLEDYDLWIRAAAAGKGIFNVPHPLVRHRIHGASAFNRGGLQNPEALRGFYGYLLKPTVVTAYYPIPSKHKMEKYLKWIFDFWPRMQCNLVFYTDTAFVDLFEKAFEGRANTRVLGLPFSSLAAFTKLSKHVWLDTKCLDTETVHTPELYAIWYEKKEFVLRTIELNPFQSKEFVWCDAGIGRYPDWIPKIQGFPARDLVPRGRMLLLEINPFIPEDYVADDNGICGNFNTRNTLGGGILASDLEGWMRWSKAYDAMLIRYHLSKRFIGKDQNIMGSIALENPDLVTLVKRPTSLGPMAGWFYLLFFLAGISIQ